MGVPTIADLRSILPLFPAAFAPSPPLSVAGHRRSAPTLPGGPEVYQGEREALYSWPDLFRFDGGIGQRMANPQAPPACAW